jgi:hypothetical protein
MNKKSIILNFKIRKNLLSNKEDFPQWIKRWKDIKSIINLY